MEIFGTKAETLGRVGPRLHKSTVPDLYYFTVADYAQSPGRILQTVTARFGDRRLVVRSSAFHGDGGAHSMAGAYTSCLGVPGQSEARGQWEAGRHTQAFEQIGCGVLLDPAHPTLCRNMAAVRAALEYADLPKAA